MSEEKCSLTGSEEKGEELARSLAWQHLVKQAEEDDDDDDEEALKKEEEEEEDEEERGVKGKKAEKTSAFGGNLRFTS